MVVQQQQQKLLKKNKFFSFSLFFGYPLKGEHKERRFFSHFILLKKVKQ